MYETLIFISLAKFFLNAQAAQNCPSILEI